MARSETEQMRELRDIDGLHPRDLSRRQRLLVVYGLGIVGVVLGFTALYYFGINRVEGRDYTVFRAFQTVVETMTTTGYGADSPWETPALNLLMVTMQVSGIVIGFVTLRVLVIPLFERTPLNLDDRLSIKNDHVVVGEYQRDTEVLLDELEQLDVDYVLVESDVEEAKRLSDDGYQAINGDPEELADLERASIRKAATLITDAGDRTASIVLTALEVNEDLRVISFTPTTRRAAALAEVGVDRSVSPHALIGQRLAEKATTPVALDVSAGDDDIAIREILVRRGCPLRNVTVGESPLAAHPDLTLVAGWFDGDLVLSPGDDVHLTPNAVLVVAGPQGEIDAFNEEMSGASGDQTDLRLPRWSGHSDVIVAGFDEGGRAAVDALAAGTTVTTVDHNPDKEPDVVGDVTEPETLHEAGIDEATALVVTVGDDATALLTVAMARALSDGVEILVRVTEGEKTGPAVRAGADYVLSVQRVSARLVAAEVHGERVMDPVGQIRLVRADGAPFVGQSLSDVRRDRERGWTVVGLTRDGTVYTTEETTVEAGDEVFVAGGDAAIREFDRTTSSG